ncbi:glutathione S-transferase [Aestuariirhabdus sp. Z084]|uniref:glutathione S-transferase family protein n=1 Tax=Aestuariirhabdus haliotis TaxID=2918751 RepID=UPI00201B4172|nr:glutathione S-transferase [Aestuariirhabdus haliotis]MCL6417654.1 glutathione S-transferase [Aestuariirhabdus haliotis]MCL6421584.1 glutathione S-transferase [Aestuariirhabdus haliotis]
MVILHHLNNSRSQRILWLLEELEIPYEIKRYQRDATTNLAPAELRAVHPLGKSPVITDGEVTIAESGAIIEYLVERYGQGRLQPADESERLQCRYWMHYAEGTLMPFMVMKLVFDRMTKAPMPFFIKPVARMIAGKAMANYIGPNLASNMTFIEQHLASNRWFAGDNLTMADFQMSFPLEASASRGALTEAHQHTAAWVAKVHARPAYQRALQAGGEYDYA